MQTKSALAVLAMLALLVSTARCSDSHVDVADSAENATSGKGGSRGAFEDYDYDADAIDYEEDEAGADNGVTYESDNYADDNVTVAHDPTHSLNDTHATRSNQTVLSTDNIGEETNYYHAQKNADPTEQEQQVATTTEIATQFAPCPSQCRCPDGRTETVNCSGLALTAIPANLPANVVRLDLSHNRIAAIDPAAFGHLQRLEEVDLSANQITTIDANLFASATGLQTVSLANNPLQLPARAELLNAPSLVELDLTNTGLHQLFDETFGGVQQLRSLRLWNNTLGQDLNVAAFANLTSLLKLQLHLDTVPHPLLRQLCDTVTTIDAISSGRYDLSCYLLAVNNTFDDSTRPPQRPYVATTTTLRPLRIRTTELPPVQAQPKATAVPQAAATTNVTRRMEQPSTGGVESTKNATLIRAGGEASASPPPPQDAVQIQMAPKTLRNILIASILVAVAGLALGVCCRRDACGLKTRCCRTQKRQRQPAATDQVRPAEQRPLKDIELREIVSGGNNGGAERLQPQQLEV